MIVLLGHCRFSNFRGGKGLYFVEGSASLDYSSYTSVQSAVTQHRGGRWNMFVYLHRHLERLWRGIYSLKRRKVRTLYLLWAADGPSEVMNRSMMIDTSIERKNKVLNMQYCVKFPDDDGMVQCPEFYI